MKTIVAVVSDRGRVSDTVEYAVREARDSTGAAPLSVLFLVPVGDGLDALPEAKAEALSARVRDYATDPAVGGLVVDVDLAVISGDSAADRARSLIDALGRDVTRVILQPELGELDPETGTETCRSNARPSADRSCARRSPSRGRPGGSWRPRACPSRSTWRSATRRPPSTSPPDW
jgi:hypothetical protein